MLPTRHAAVVSLRAAWWCLRAPFVFTRALARTIVGLGGAWALATQDAIACRGCGQAVSLVGRFECGWCGYVFDGFAFARCEVCGAVPPFIECQSCSTGFKNPTIFP
jgi:hypothetical protein